jgi:hypothetical protein
MRAQLQIWATGPLFALSRFGRDKNPRPHARAAAGSYAARTLHSTRRARLLRARKAGFDRAELGISCSAAPDPASWFAFLALRLARSGGLGARAPGRCTSSRRCDAPPAESLGRLAALAHRSLRIRPAYSHKLARITCHSSELHRTISIAVGPGHRASCTCSTAPHLSSASSTARMIPGSAPLATRWRGPVTMKFDEHICCARPGQGRRVG